MHRLQFLCSFARGLLPNVALETESAKWLQLSIAGVGVLGAFGGHATVTAMTMAHIFAGRRWLGWYNQPGTHDVARRYGQLPRSSLCSILYSTHRSSVDPAILCELKGAEPGPSYLPFPAGTSGNGRKTSNLAWLVLDQCATTPCANQPIPCKPLAGGEVSVINLEHVPDTAQTVQLPQGAGMLAMAAVPVVCSLLTCVACALLGDWYCASMIVFGVVIGGISSRVIGSGRLAFAYTKSAAAPSTGPRPRRAGVLHTAANMVVLKGPSGALDAITAGRFFLDYGHRPTYLSIGICSVLLSLQLLVQSLVASQGQFYGRLLFLVTLAVSWAYNLHLASLDVNTLLRRALFEQVLRVDRVPAAQLGADAQTRLGTVRSGVDRCKLKNFTQQAVFALLVLAECERLPLGMDMVHLKLVLDGLLPFRASAPESWNVWKGEVLRNIEQNAECLRDEARRCEFRFQFPPVPVEGGLGQGLVEGLYDDADAAAKVYAGYRNGGENPPVPQKTAG